MGSRPARHSRFARRSQSAPATTLLAVIVLSGCAGSGKRVSEAERDTSGSHDGRYSLQINAYRGQQTFPGNWTANCTTDGWRWPIQVIDGQLTLLVDLGENGPQRPPTGFVNEAGQFRLDIPTGQTVAASGTSDLTVDNGAVTYIIGGSLAADEMSGRFTNGIAQFGNAGCSYSMDIVRT